MSDPAPPDAPGETSVLPVVARGRAGPPTWALVLGGVLAAVLLFTVLDARRRAGQAPAIAASPVDLGDLPAAVPTLQIPPEPAPAPPVAMPPPVVALPIAAAPYTQAPLPPVQPYGARAAPIPPPAAPIVLRPPEIGRPAPVAAGGPAVVIDNNTAPAAGQRPAPNATSPLGAAASTERVHAGMLSNRATTVVQGTLIHAVLETGFDSTRPGFARATVSRDIMGFDGSRVLIPRGSRLIGEYQADVRPGQKRALIIWTRLIRPDGATIEIGSPASDPVGRGGVKADVNSHFLQRFSGAILQSALDVGINLASRRANSSVIVAMPSGAGGATSQLIQPATITPTLTVKPGAAISIFVARDLDFTEVENRP